MSKCKASVEAHEFLVYAGLLKKCKECGRVFDLWNAVDADEWAHGHDCEGS